MFRISQYMQEIKTPMPLGTKRNPPGPVVIWNLIRRCNLTCKHCYSISADTDFPGELSTAEIYKVMDDLKGFHVPVLILSGGEPLMRPDIFDISRRARCRPRRGERPSPMRRVQLRWHKPVWSMRSSAVRSRRRRSTVPASRSPAIRR